MITIQNKHALWILFSHRFSDIDSAEANFEYTCCFTRVDIGTTEPLLLDVLINALTCISSEYDLNFLGACAL